MPDDWPPTGSKPQLLRDVGVDRLPAGDAVMVRVEQKQPRAPLVVHKNRRLRRNFETNYTQYDCRNNVALGFEQAESCVADNWRPFDSKENIRQSLEMRGES